MKLHHKFLMFIGLITMSPVVNAQLNPLSSQYYINQYLINPAFAGADHGLKINGAYRKLWSNVENAPLTQNLTADYGFGKSGVGITVNRESEGLQRQTRLVGSYAYHLKLNSNNQQLHFGMSVGFQKNSLEVSDLHGNPIDPLVRKYNARDTYWDGDFGVAYTSDKLNVEAAIPNLKSVLKKDVIDLADVPTFYSALSYKVKLNGVTEGLDAEPKVAFRGVKGHDNIWDAGAQFGINNKQVIAMVMYHSTQNATFGLGLDYLKKYMISGTYTTQTSALSNYTNGSFELNLRLNLSK